MSDADAVLAAIGAIAALGLRSGWSAWSGRPGTRSTGGRPPGDVLHALDSTTIELVKPCGAVTALGFTYARVRERRGLGPSWRPRRSRAASAHGGYRRTGVRRADAQPDHDPVNSAEERVPGHAGVPRDPRAVIVVATVGAKFAPSARSGTS
jgi:hypothetical protein